MQSSWAIASNYWALLRNGIELRVHPTLVPTKRLLANVEGAMNAVQVYGDAVGTTLYYGKGAGSEPTASAVIADLVDYKTYRFCQWQRSLLVITCVWR